MLKKGIFILIFIFLACTISVGFTQEKPKTKSKSKKEKKVSKRWANKVWKEVKKTVEDDKYFKTERITTVAGVRGTPKSIFNHPTPEDVKKAITALEERIKIISAEDIKDKDKQISKHKFLIAQCYSEIGENEKAIEYYEDLIKNYKETKYSKDAETELKKLKNP